MSSGLFRNSCIFGFLILAIVPVHATTTQLPGPEYTFLPSGSTPEETNTGTPPAGTTKAPGAKTTVATATAVPTSLDTVGPERLTSTTLKRVSDSSAALTGSLTVVMATTVFSSILVLGR